MDRVIKSVVWFTACSTLGYSLLLLTSTDKIELNQKLLKTYPEAEGKKSLIVETLRRAAENKTPMYLQTKREIEETIVQKQK